MAGGGFGRVYGGVGTVLLPKQRIPSSSSSSQPLDSFISGSSSSFLGSSSMVSFKDGCGGKRSERYLFQTYDEDENLGDDDYEDYFHQPEKKRRLTVEQVRFLEKSFETENKLEPERKVELAKELGLQPRQVAIWFQNRRARWKTKQLEKDFDTLQASYDSLKADYDNLIKEKEKLQAEVVHLTDKLHLKGKHQIDHSELPTTNNEQRQGKQQEAEPIIDSASESEKQHSSKSDVVDSDRVDSDISQDDEDYLISKSLIPSPHAFDLSVDDHSLMFWPTYWDINPKI